MALRASSTRCVNASRDGDSTTALRSLFQCLSTLWGRNCLSSPSKLPLVQPVAVSSCPVPCSLGAETSPLLAPSSCQAVVESDKVPPEHSLLQTKPPQFLQVVPHKTCVAVPSSPPVPFYGLAVILHSSSTKGECSPLSELFHSGFIDLHFRELLRFVKENDAVAQEISER